MESGSLGTRKYPKDPKISIQNSTEQTNNPAPLSSEIQSPRCLKSFQGQPKKEWRAEGRKKKGEREKKKAQCCLRLQKFQQNSKGTVSLATKLASCTSTTGARPAGWTTSQAALPACPWILCFSRRVTHLALALGLPVSGNESKGTEREQDFCAVCGPKRVDPATNGKTVMLR